MQNIVLICDSITGWVFLQWCNRQGGIVPPDVFHREIFDDLLEKWRQRKKGKWRRKTGKLGKGRWEIRIEGEEVWKWAEDFFFSLFETTEICLGYTKMENFYRKKHISRREKIGNSDFAPSEKYSSYTTGFLDNLIQHNHTFEFKIFMWKCKFMHCAGFLLLCMTTFTSQTINLHVHKLTLPRENLKLKLIFQKKFFFEIAHKTC